MDIQEENNLIQEAFEVEADEVGFCLDQKWGDYENPYESSDTALAFNLFKKGWQAAKAHQAEKKGCVVVPKSEITDWYLDEDEYIYTDEPDIFLCDLEPGDVLEVKRQQCWQVECQFAAKVYEDEDNINWELFDSKEEAEKAAAHCKAMVEAARGGNE